MSKYETTGDSDQVLAGIRVTESSLDNVPSLEDAQSGLKGIRGRIQLKTFTSLQSVDFRYLWFGILFMSAGTWMQRITLNWLIYDLTNSPILLGALNAMRTLPYLFLALHVGVIIDRVDKRRLLIFLQPILIASTAILGTLIVMSRVQVWHVFVFALVTAIVWAISQPLRQTLVPSLVPKGNLTNALSLTSMGYNINKVLGPALGGLLIGAVGAGGNFFIQSAAYMGVLFMVYAMNVPPRQNPPRQSSAIADIKEGLDYVRAKPAVLAVIMTALIPPLFAMPYLDLMPIFQKDVLGVGPEALGLMLAAPGIGALISLSTLATIGDRIKHKGILLLGGMGFFGLFIIIFSRMTTYPFVLLPLIGAGFCHLIFLVISNTMLQLLTPEELRGRILSIYYLNRGIGPLGSLVAGILANYLGAPLTVTLMGSGVILFVLLIAWRAPVIYQVET